MHDIMTYQSTAMFSYVLHFYIYVAICTANKHALLNTAISMNNTKLVCDCLSENHTSDVAKLTFHKIFLECYRKLKFSAMIK